MCHGTAHTIVYLPTFVSTDLLYRAQEIYITVIHFYNTNETTVILSHANCSSTTAIVSLQSPVTRIVPYLCEEDDRLGARLVQSVGRRVELELRQRALVHLNEINR